MEQHDVRVLVIGAFRCYLSLIFQWLIRISLQIGLINKRSGLTDLLYINLSDRRLSAGGVTVIPVSPNRL